MKTHSTWSYERVALTYINTYRHTYIYIYLFIYSAFGKLAMVESS